MSPMTIASRGLAVVAKRCLPIRIIPHSFVLPFLVRGDEKVWFQLEFGKLFCKPIMHYLTCKTIPFFDFSLSSQESL